MARVEIPVIQAVLNGGTANAGGTINTSNGAVIAGGGRIDTLVLRIDNTGVAGTVSVLPGVDPAAITSQSGTVEIAVGGTAEAFVVLEGARVAQADGSIYLNFSTNMAGTVQAVQATIASV